MYQDVKGIVGRGTIDKWRAQWQLNLHLLSSMKRKTTSKDIIYQVGMSKLGCDFSSLYSRKASKAEKKLSKPMFAYIQEKQARQRRSYRSLCLLNKIKQVRGRSVSKDLKISA